MSSITPPRLGCDLIRAAEPLPVNLQRWTRTWRIEPLTSDPIATPPPTPKVQSLIVTFSVGRSTRSPSASLPALIEILSSLQAMSQPEMLTSRQEHTSIPSELGIY